MRTNAANRRLTELAIGRFVEMAWARQGPARYVSVLTMPVIVAFLVPGLWWLVCAAGAVIGLVVDLRAHAMFTRIVSTPGDADDGVMAAAMGRHVAMVAIVTAAYVLPYALLAFAPSPGPVVGLLFCAGVALVSATLHVMTPTMVYSTAPSLLIGLMLNGFALGEGMNQVALALLAGVVGVHMMLAARSGAANFDDIVLARLRAEDNAEMLDRRVQERTEQLAIATHRAESANRAKSMFLANMSHELRTPLNAINGYAELIEEDLGPDARSIEDLQRIRVASDRLLSLISEILDFARIEAGKLELRCEWLELEPLLRETLETVRPAARKNGNECILNLEPGVGAVYGDATRVRQCLLNLLSNSAKFTQNGRIELAASRTSTGGRESVCIAVRDTGAGIRADDMERLFQPFEQADHSLTRKHDGAGLGLVITRRLARAMGGDVFAASEFGKGSTFTLILPEQAPAANAA